MTQLSNEQQAAIIAAAEKLVRCKGRYHSEQNYRALAALFGVTVPDLPPLAAEAPEVPEEWRQSLQEMVTAMRHYEMDADEDAPGKHKAMMRRANALLSEAPDAPPFSIKHVKQPSGGVLQLVGEVVARNHPNHARNVDFRWLDFNVEPGTKLYAIKQERG